MIKEFINAVNEEKPYDFIAQNYWHMRVEDLGRICLELIYAMDDEQLQSAAEELEDYV